ncbi:MAG: hypothetical protein ACTSPV_14470 [Candidatus Hodarchaeales archaeon]
MDFCELLLGGIVALLFPEIGISLVIEMFIPPHMALCLTSGGLVSMVFTKQKVENWMNDKDRTIGVALSVGATFTVPLLILLNVIL